MPRLTLTYLISSILILIVLSSAVTGEVQSSPIKNTIHFGKEATYRFTITNTAPYSQQYVVFSLQSAQGWNVAAEPLIDRVFTLLPGQNKTLTISARPVRDLPVGIYYLPVTIQGNQGDTYTESLKVYLGKETLETYSPSLAVTIDTDDIIAPGQSHSVKLFLENKNRLDLSSLTISMVSELAEFNHQVTIDLPSLSKKTVEFTVQSDRYSQPRDYTISFRFDHQGKSIKSINHKITVPAIASPFTVSEQSQTIFGRRVGTLSIRNEGNVKNEQQVLYPIAWLESFLVEGNTGIVKSSDGTKNIAYTLSLSPQESTTLYYTINYRWLIYTLLLIILIIAFILFARSPLRLIKKATTLQKDDTGAIAELKVILEIENKTDQPIKKLTVTDTVPGIVSVEKISELGTLRPIEIRHHGGKTRIVWMISELDAHEDRLITYKVRSKLNILGTLGLPRATCEFKARQGLRRKAYSNPFTLS